MHIIISREALLKPMMAVNSVVERRHTLPVLANVLLSVEDKQLSITGTDMEVELIGRTPVDEVKTAGAITVPARKFLDICRTLAEGAKIEISVKSGKLTLKSGRSRFVLTTRSADEFPAVEDEAGDTFSVTLEQQHLSTLLANTGFSMAQQDVRYYLNGMLFEATKDYLRVVATDGHRLAMDTLKMSNDISEQKQMILPRKGVMELTRLLEEEGDVKLTFGKNHIRAEVPSYTLNSILVDAKFPPYERVLPKDGDKIVTGDREELRQAFTRAAILSNEKYHGVRVVLSSGELKILANNPEQEEAEDAVSVDYSGDKLEMGFNVSYLIDVLTTIGSEKARITLSNPNSSALIQPDGDSEALYVVMPMKL
ncbi:MAG: DNA polymerase III subunit beta [Pseudohongiellaceae bacterium]